MADKMTSEVEVVGKLMVVVELRHSKQVDRKAHRIEHMLVHTAWVVLVVAGMVVVVRVVQERILVLVPSVLLVVDMVADKSLLENKAYYLH